MYVASALLLNNTHNTISICASQIKYMRPMPFFAVSLLLLSEESKCPSLPVTAQCTVKQPKPDDLILIWECEDGMNALTECSVVCSNNFVFNLTCKFGDIYDIRKVSCNTVDGEAVIVSEATFKTTSMCDVLVFCSYKGNEAKNISASIQSK